MKNTKKICFVYKNDIHRGTGLCPFPIEIVYDFLYNHLMNTSTKRQNKQKIAYDFLRAKIVDGEWGPGYRIVIDQVARDLGISTIPIREAIRQLEADGLIEYKPYSGAIVSAINETKYLESLSVLAVLEGFATALSAERMTEGQIQELERINDAMKEAVADFDFEKFGALNRRFHTVIYHHCGNQFLIETVIQIWEQMDRIRRTVFSLVPKRAQESIQEHEHIIQLLREKAPQQEIEKFVREHKLNTVRAFQLYKAGK